jgi:hypothetical protein
MMRKIQMMRVAVKKTRAPDSIADTFGPQRPHCKRQQHVRLNLCH